MGTVMRPFLLGLVGLLTVGACEGKKRGLNQPTASADAAVLPTGGTDGGGADSVAPPSPDSSLDVPPDRPSFPPDAAPTSPDLPVDVPVETAIANFDLLPTYPDASPDLPLPPPDTLPALPDVPADSASSFKNLEIAKTGAGTGTVTSSPPGINCGSTCSADFPTGTVVTLTPIASATSAFTGWTGQWHGTEACTLTIGGNSWASANFAPQYTFLCDPVSPQDPHDSLLTCPVGFGCAPADSLPPASNCVQQSGSGGMYSACLTQDRCALGYSCTRQYCLKYCFSVADCPPSSSCLDFFPTPSYAGTTRVGYCVQYGTAGTDKP